MDDLDALLADLQSTTAHLSGTNQGDYNHVPYNSDHNSEVHRYYKNDISPGSQRTMREVTITSSSSYRQNSGTSPTFNSNLSELDSLLEDLNTSKYNSYTDKKAPGSPRMNGPSRYKSISPTSSLGSSGGFQEMRPSVESLLDELQSAVPNNPRDRYVTTSVTRTVHRTTSPSRGYRAPSASSATQELDDLMASLSDFKISSAPTPSQATILTTLPSGDPLYAKPNKAKPPHSPVPPSSHPRSNHLDSMLGTLQSDMNRQGINTAQKGCCAACGKPIVGQVVTALAKTWHPEHFTCAHCQQELGTKNFFERDGRPYCEPDYHNLFSPRCAYCNGPIFDKCVTALDKSWHPEHFFCAQCGNQFGEDGFHEKDGKAYCKNDYFEMFAPKCGGCSRPIMENYISALNTQWHPDCFVCRDCKQKLQGGSFYSIEGKPVCSKCSGVGDDDVEEED